MATSDNLIHRLKSWNHTADSTQGFTVGVKSSGLKHVVFLVVLKHNIFLHQEERITR